MTTGTGESARGEQRKHEKNWRMEAIVGRTKGEYCVEKQEEGRRSEGRGGRGGDGKEGQTREGTRGRTPMAEI